MIPHSRLIVTSAIAAICAAPLAPTPALAAPADEWFVSDAPAAENGEDSPYSVRTRYASFDAEQAMQQLVTPEEVAAVAPGTRVEVQRDSSLNLKLFNDRQVEINVAEIAITQPADESGAVVEAVGDVISADPAEAGGSSSITFTPNESGEYELRAHIGDTSSEAVNITQAGPGTAQIDEVDTTNAPPADEGSDAIPAPPITEDDAPSEPLPMPDSGYWTIDLVAGYPASMGSQMKSVIAQQVGQTNTAMRNSGVNIRVNLVATIALDYQQEYTLSKDLDNMRKGLGGVRPLTLMRDTVGADLIALMVPRALGACGVGYLPHSRGHRDYGFSVSAYDNQCTGKYSFSHEIGHNLGAHHARDDDDQLYNWPFDYSYGHKVNGVARSLMSYDCKPQANCPRLLQFSNPNLDFLGHPGVRSGTRTNDNARSLNNMAPIVAAYGTPVPSSRIAGSDRFATAAAISQHAFANPRTVRAVMVANGGSYADSASAAPLGMRLSAPLLLTQQWSLPRVTANEVARLRPERIIVIGSEASVGEAVVEQLRAASPGATIVRIGGVDRYETSLKIAEYGWSGMSLGTVFMATGSNFPDALAAGAAAGTQNMPMLLVHGTADSISSRTQTFLQRGGARKVIITGSDASVSLGIERTLSRLTSVERYAGADRFETSAMIAANYSTFQGRVYIASGMNFPDGLTGGVAAAFNRAPLVLARQTCLPEPVAVVVIRIQPSQRFVLGGTPTLTEGVRVGEICAA